jgi:ATP/maltotriose-dependent transcriptional regulator MalT
LLYIVKVAGAQRAESPMRTHTRSIFNKLGVSSRRAAVRQAEELDLLSRTPKH